MYKLYYFQNHKYYIYAVIYNNYLINFHIYKKILFLINNKLLIVNFHIITNTNLI